MAVGALTNPSTEEILTIDQTPAFFIDGTTVFMPKNTPNSSTSNVNLKSFHVNSSRGLKIPTPALFTSTVTGPNKYSNSILRSS